jgi:CO/xanthine dehydrogenase FAD-binding subunit
MPLSLETYATVAEANAALKKADARYMGGGTLCVRAANEGDLSFETFVRTTERALRQVRIEDGIVTLGASVTMAEIARHPQLTAIAKAARAVGGPAVRNMATVGGNLFAPSPYGDFAAALLALDAMVTIEDREMPLETLLAGRNVAGGIVTVVRFNLPKAETFRFLKVSRVKPKGVSVLSIAALIETAPDGSVADARIALGCMADRPIRARAAETVLGGRPLTAEGVSDAVAHVTDGIDPPTDPVASAWYRREVLPVHFRRLLLG